MYLFIYYLFIYLFIVVVQVFFPYKVTGNVYWTDSIPFMFSYKHKQIKFCVLILKLDTHKYDVTYIYKLKLMRTMSSNTYQQETVLLWFLVDMMETLWRWVTILSERVPDVVIPRKQGGINWTGSFEVRKTFGNRLILNKLELHGVFMWWNSIVR